MLKFSQICNISKGKSTTIALPVMPATSAVSLVWETSDPELAIRTTSLITQNDVPSTKMTDTRNGTNRNTSKNSAILVG